MIEGESFVGRDKELEKIEALKITPSQTTSYQ
jgi:hypothetical protein